MAFNIITKEKAINDINGALNYLTEYFYYRSAPTTEGDIYQINLIKTKIEFISKLMYEERDAKS